MCAVVIDNIHSESGNYKHVLKPPQIKMSRTFMSTEMKPTLEKFILKSNNDTDRKKAMELLSSIDEHKKSNLFDNQIIKEYKLKRNLQRPKTAFARLHDGPFLQRFSTTYNEFFPVRELKETNATRPSSTVNIIVRPNNTDEIEDEMKDNIDVSNEVTNGEVQKNLSSYQRETSYNKDYCSQDNIEQVKLKKDFVTRAATSSGSRCHNPHPSQAFLVWRYPRELHTQNTKLPSTEILKANMENKFAHITDEQFDRVMRGNCRSTYQSDFVGGIYPENRLTPFYIHPTIKNGEKLKISTQRVDYNYPQSLPTELSVPRDRYKCNKTKDQSAQGIIPEAVNKVYMNTHVRTTYDEDINDRAEIIHGEIVNDIQRKIDLTKVHNMKSLEKAMIGAQNIEDKETLRRIFQKMNEPEDYKRKSFVRKPFYTNDRPCWTSNWPGPL